MKREWVFALVGLVIVFGLFLFIGFQGKSLTGGAVESMPSFGPSSEEQACMMQCMGCTSIGVGCTGNSEQCQAQCNVQKPEQTEEEKCVETCALEGCGEYDFACQEKNREKCDEECGMVKAPDESDMSAEQLCITNCVEEKAPGTICGNSQTGETGGSVCQECAQQCVHLYEGPCLDDDKLSAKKKECETCEHCFGEPVMGDSGEGWECIVDVECKDASGEFGDMPGTGEDSWEEGHEPGSGNVVTEAVGNVIESIGDFFSGIFGGE